ncbi:MAG: hypothetical protein JSR91_12870 [Proteobacteria bacterium]|nr:hypothetical protein [Pseudomonadota bacterium]
MSSGIPDRQHDMHDGLIGQGDRWLRQKLDYYVEWFGHHNSLFILTFDEDNDRARNLIPTLFGGDGVAPGHYHERIDHCRVLQTVLAMFGLHFTRPVGLAAPIRGIWRGKQPLPSALHLDSDRKVGDTRPPSPSTGGRARRSISRAS